MHRTQVLLDDAQFVELRSVARNLGKSMGGLIRDFVNLGLSQRRTAKGGRRFRLADVTGIINDSRLNAADHDAFLYGEEA